MARASKYPDEFVARGVWLALEPGRPIAHVAHDLGNHPKAPRRRVCQARADAGERATCLQRGHGRWHMSGSAQLGDLGAAISRHSNVHTASLRR